MKFSSKLSLVILITGLIVLFIVSAATYKLNHASIIKSQFTYTTTLAEEISDDIDLLLYEKVKTAQTLANSPIFKKVLEASNSSYVNLSNEKREASIKRQNSEWKSTKDPAADLIQKFTNNDAAQYLKEQQSLIKNEYGEIFLTNRFGALVASTAKLSTFAHGHKYWWKGAYNNSKGAVFFDDRGYDDSVGGYVLGLVVPVKKGGKIIGILKCNLNVLGSISTLIAGSKHQLIGKFKLTRSGGEIVFEDGSEPLSTTVNNATRENMRSLPPKPIIVSIGGKKHIVGFAEISVSTGSAKFGFGGSFTSVDHKKGNKGESWFVLCYRQMDIAEEPLIESLKSIIVAGSLITLFLVFVSYLFGQKIANPLLTLNKAASKIGKGDLDYRIDMSRDDEFGNLSSSFNLMADNIQQRRQQLELQTEKLKNTNLELIHQRKQVEDASRLKSEFLSNMSHELRTPLNSIMILSHVIIKDAVDRLTKDEHNYLKVINRNGQKLLSLITDILDLSKIESGKMTLSFKAVSVNSIISEIIDNLEVIAEKKGIKLKNCIKEIIEIESVESRVYQIFQNLIGNAVKFTEEGEVSITAKIDAERLQMEILDTGIGISEDELPHVFDEFRQVDGTSTRKYEGTGLGLAIAYKSARVLGGSLTVKSTLGKGSVFTAYLPISIGKETQTTQPAPAQSTPTESSKGSILVIDDDPITTAMIAGFLSDAGYHVIPASSGEEGLTIAKDHDIIAITLDVIMPDMDGFEVLQELKSIPETATIPVILISSQEDKQTGFAMGAAGFLAKPVDREKLITEINKSFQQKSSSILVIEDNPDNMLTIRALLGDKFQVYEAEDGEEGLDLAMDKQPDLILLDISLPGMDGFTVVKKIKETLEINSTPVIALTAHVMKGDREKILTAGCDDYLPKPIDPDALLEKINQHLIQ